MGTPLTSMTSECVSRCCSPSVSFSLSNAKDDNTNCYTTACTTEQKYYQAPDCTKAPTSELCCDPDYCMCFLGYSFYRQCRWPRVWNKDLLTCVKPWQLEA